MDITGYKKRCFFKQWLVGLLIVVALSILNQNSAQALSRDDYLKLKCEDVSGKLYYVDLGVDPQYDSHKPMQIFTLDVTQCDNTTVNKDMVGCLEASDTSNGSLPAGVYEVHGSYFPSTIQYTVLANYAYNNRVFVMPRIGKDFNLANTGYIFNQGGGGDIKLSWYVALMPPEGDSGLRFVNAGNYRGYIAVNIYSGPNNRLGTNCNNWLASYLHYQIYISTWVRITNKCTIVKVDPLNFGEHVSLNKEIRAYSNIDIACNVENPPVNTLTPFILKFNNGQNATQNGQRRMKSASNNYIDYDIFYQENNMPVGDVPGLQYKGTDSQTVKIVGRVKKRDGKIPGGLYTDVVLLTLEY